MRDNMNSFDLVNLKEFTNSLFTERNSTFIVHNGPLTGKSKYAKLFAEKSKGKYLDLLERFGEDTELKNRIDVFDIRDLENLLVKEAKDTKLLILDNVEFLLNTWDKDGYDLLFHLLTKNWDSFKISYRAVLGVFLITNRKILESELTTSKGDKRIFHLNELESLEGGPEYVQD
jgi:hypothetical protein